MLCLYFYGGVLRLRDNFTSTLLFHAFFADVVSVHSSVRMFDLQNYAVDLYEICCCCGGVCTLRCLTNALVVCTDQFLHEGQTHWPLYLRSTVLGYGKYLMKCSRNIFLVCAMWSVSSSAAMDST
jgi:hypothetical protein